MDIDSPFEGTPPRACDRCHSLKTQCSFDNPCARCKRLELRCTNDRPQRTRGRPPKGTKSRSRSSARLNLPNSQEDEDSLSSQSGQLSEISPFLQGLPELCFPHDALSSLVESFLGSAPALGLYSIIPACTSLNLYYDHPLERAFGDLLLQTEVRCVIIAVAMELFGPSVPGYKEERATIDRDSLHSVVFSSFQNVWLGRNHLTPANALCLLLLSHTWSATETFAEASTRWCAFGRVIADHGNNPAQHISSYSQELTRRTNIGLRLQECSLALTHNRVDMLRPQDESRIASPVMSDSEWHSTIQSSDSHTYFALFGPFIDIIKDISQEYTIGSTLWIKVESQLEDYFFQFPQDLLQFSAVRYTYQFEAMIWLHGLFIIHHSTRDIIDLLKRPTYIDVDRFCHILEHSLLVGEVLNAMLRMESPHMGSISPTTIYFICLSSAVYCIALRQFINQSELDHISPPENFIRLAKSHIEAFKALQGSYKRGDQLIIRQMQYLLSSCLKAEATGRQADMLGFTCESLSLYRWTHRGTGMVRMDPEKANQEWNYLEGPGSALWDDSTGLETKLIAAILQLCSPKQRICSDGYFDLTIMIPM